MISPEKYLKGLDENYLENWGSEIQNEPEDAASAMGRSIFTTPSYQQSAAASMRGSEMSSVLGD
jgi:hypothetical protein